jgi:hypothetical protein
VALPQSPATGGQCHCNGTRGTKPPTSTGERCFLLGLLLGYIAQLTKLYLVGRSYELTVVLQSQANKNMSREAEETVGICHKMTGEDTAG